ncbi:hypothetical protein P22_2310 [Propionispora sp. 2/2-37]|nr:hypothetical protein P22_2310 [Propionispora sp. 2/2-37]
MKPKEILFQWIDAFNKADVEFKPNYRYQRKSLLL